MKWLNIAGLILQFISFWLAAPELLGAETLKRLENGLRKLLALIPVIAATAVVGGYGLFFAVGGIIKGLKASEEGMTGGDLMTFYISLAICTVFYLIFVFRYKRIMKYLDEKIAQPLTLKLINNNEMRTTALVIGAVLFTIGFLCQLAVAIIN